jgi:hypothetical protein
LNCHIIHNDILCVATLTRDPDRTAQHLVTRYFFSQFWCEFTKKVLADFLAQDMQSKQLQNVIDDG